MCGRYFIGAAEDDAELLKIIEIANRRGGMVPIKTFGEIFPGDKAPVIARNRKGEVSVFGMQWGYRMQDGRRIINARSETAGKKPMFREGMQRRRCLIPASYYFEWERQGGRKKRYGIGADGEKTLYMAGIYRLEETEAVFSILTCPPADEIGFIHDRMPVILPRMTAGEWLAQERKAEHVLSQACRRMRFWPCYEENI